MTAPLPSTIADSLAPPMCLPLSFSLCQSQLADVVTVSDDAIIDAMAMWWDRFHIELEPAGAAGTAALLGPLRERLRGKRVGLVLCGANIARDDFRALLSRSTV